MVRTGGPLQMYESHWGLTQPPFRTRVDPAVYHPAASHEEALARLQFLVDNQSTAGMLVGPYGGGKSMLFEILADRLRRLGYHVASTNLTACDTRGWLWNLVTSLRLSTQKMVHDYQLWRAVLDRLEEHRYQRLRTVFLLDDADNAAAEVQLALLRLLAAVRLSGTTLLLSVGPGYRGKLDRRLIARCDLRVELEPWTLDETEAFVRSRLQSAGAQTELLDPTAVQRLYRRSGGIPLAVAQLAEMSLVAAAGQGLTHVDEATVETVFQELLAVRS